MSNCYLCGSSPATNPADIKKTFTSHGSAKAPYSDRMCDRCIYTTNLRCWYYNPAKQQYSAIYGRGFSWLWQGDVCLAPRIGAERTEKAGKQGSFTLPEVANLPTRAEMRQWLINPPEPPFRIVIAESGQKHIDFLAQTAYSRDIFPVQFELDSLVIDRSRFTDTIHCYEALLALGFTKTEIDSGDYRSDRLIPVFDKFQPIEEAIAKIRGSRMLSLVSYLAIAPK